VPCGPFENLVSEVQKLRERIAGGEKVDYGQVENEVAAGAAAMERAAHEVLLGGLDVNEARVLIDGVEHVQV